MHNQQLIFTPILPRGMPKGVVLFTHYPMKCGLYYSQINGACGSCAVSCACDLGLPRLRADLNACLPLVAVGPCALQSLLKWPVTGRGPVPLDMRAGPAGPWCVASISRPGPCACFYLV